MIGRFTDCFDQELTKDEARACRDWLMRAEGKPFLNYLAKIAKLKHDSSINALTDNPIKDILVSQRSLGAEQAIQAVLERIDYEIDERKKM